MLICTFTIQLYHYHQVLAVARVPSSDAIVEETGEKLDDEDELVAFHLLLILSMADVRVLISATTKNVAGYTAVCHVGWTMMVHWPACMVWYLHRMDAPSTSLYIDGPRAVTSGCPVHGSMASAQPPRERMSAAIAIAQPQKTSSKRIFAASVSVVNVVSGVIVGWNVTTANICTALFGLNGPESDARSGAAGIIVRKSVRNVSGTRWMEYSSEKAADVAADGSRILIVSGCCTHVLDVMTCASEAQLDDDDDICNNCDDVITSSEDAELLSANGLVISSTRHHRYAREQLRQRRRSHYSCKNKSFYRCRRLLI